MSKKSKGPIYSAFVLCDDQTWEQPSFRVKGRRDDRSIEQALIGAVYGAFIVYGLQEDPDAPDCCVKTLNTKTQRWELSK